MKTPKDTIHTTKTKETHKVRNWSTYNTALVARGSLTLWIPDDIEKWWYGDGHDTYSDRAIETVVSLYVLHGMSLRATQGFVESIFTLMDIPLTTPDYSTISRRADTLKTTLRKTPKEHTDIILDSTGAKLFGEGEWKVRKHGYSKRRSWKKIHIAIGSDGDIRAVEVSDNSVTDAQMVKDILAQETAQITDFYGDGAYDTGGVYDTLAQRGVVGYHIPPQINAKIWYHGNRHGHPHPRDENLRAIRRSSRKKWKQSSGYHRRSLGETVMFRYKSTFGDRMSLRTKKRQENEVITKCNILNTFHALGMPESSPVP